MEEQERLISQFNDAIPKLNRLANSWERCKEYRRKGQLLLWFWELDNPEIELDYDMQLIDAEQKTKEQKYCYKLEQATIKIQKAMIKRDKYAMYQHLKEKERLLREIQEESGQGGKRKSTEEDEMEE